MLYELLVGRPPFAGETHIATAMMHVHEAPRSPRSVRAGISKAIEAAVLKALEKEPDARFQSAAEMRSALAGSSTGAATTAVFERPPVAATTPAASDDHHGPSALRWIVPVVLLIAAAVAAAFMIPSLLEDDEGAGEATPTPPRPQAIRVVGVTDFDPPPGDGQENPDELPAATDGDPASAWTTVTYFTELSLQKPGVGLLFDLGSAQEVTRVRVRSPSPGYTFELRKGAEPGLDADDFERIALVEDAEDDEKVEVDDSAQYWLLWITDLPGGGEGEARIGEVQFFGP